MSQATVDSACDLVSAFNGADWGRLEALLAPGCVYDEVGTGRKAERQQEVAEVFKGGSAQCPMPTER